MASRLVSGASTVGTRADVVACLQLAGPVTARILFDRGLDYKWYPQRQPTAYWKARFARGEYAANRALVLHHPVSL